MLVRRVSSHYVATYSDDKKQRPFAQIGLSTADRVSELADQISHESSDVKLMYSRAQCAEQRNHCQLVLYVNEHDGTSSAEILPIVYTSPQGRTKA